MLDPILSIAAVAFVATPLILHFLILDRPVRRSDDRNHGRSGALRR